MILVLVGPPGAGKGTQADMLVSRKGFRTLSTGDALRKHIKNRTDIGKVVADIMGRGELVPDDVLFKILEEELGTDKEEVVLLDGYPRNVEQAKTLSAIGTKNPVMGVVHVDVPKEMLVERLSGRRTCGSCSATFHVVTNPPQKNGVCDRCGEVLVQRPDDSEDKVQKRLEVYETSTEPVLSYYKNTNAYFRVDGVGTTDEVYTRLEDVVSGLLR